MTTSKHWTEANVKAIADALPELKTLETPGQRAALIAKHQDDILGPALARGRDSLHMSLYPGKRLLRMLEAVWSTPAVPVEEPRDKACRDIMTLANEANLMLARTPRPKVKLRTCEWTALAHHPHVKPLLDKKAFCTPNQLVGVLERAQRDVLPDDRWRDETQWHSAIYRASRGSDGAKRDALSMLREGIKFQPLARFVTKESAPVPTPPEAAPIPQETPAMAPSIFVPSGNPADTPLVQAIVGFISALQERAEATMAPLLERIARLEDQMRAIPAAVGRQVAEVVGGPDPAVPAHVMAELPVFTHERLPRVDVVGLLGNQADVVRRACGTQWNLRFLSAEEVERHPITARNAIMVRKFVSHSAQERIKKAGAKLHYANGAAESVIAQLNSLAIARLN